MPIVTLIFTKLSLICQTFHKTMCNLRRFGRFTVISEIEIFMAVILTNISIVTFICAEQIQLF